jgi:beta-lactamase class A
MIYRVALSLGLVAGLAAPLAAQNLAADVTRMLDAIPARSSIYAKHLPSGKTVAVRADQSMNTLSVIKIAVMMRAFRDVEAGTLKLTDRFVVRPEDRRGGSGLIQTFDPGLQPTYRDLIEQMIITSDNTATDILIKKVGLKQVNEMLGSFGFKRTRLLATTGDLFREVWILADRKNAKMTDLEVFEKGFPTGPDMAKKTFQLEGDSTKWLGVTTAREMADILEGILNAKFASKEHSRMMVDIMKRQFYSSRLPQRLQWKGVEIAHKTGDWPPYAGNDVGILFYPGGPTIVSVFTGQNTGEFFDLEATEGRIAERLVKEWK